MEQWNQGGQVALQHPQYERVLSHLPRPPGCDNKYFVFGCSLRWDAISGSFVCLEKIAGTVGDVHGFSFSFRPQVPVCVIHRNLVNLSELLYGDSTENISFV